MVAKKAAAGGTDEGDNVVLEYLRKQNRPYNANDIFSNLHGKVPKTAVEKTLTTLAEKGEITMKVNGKQKIFVARQDQLESPSSELLDQMDKEISDLKEQLVALKEESKALSGGVSKLQNSLTIDEMKKRIATLEKENAKRAERLTVLRKGENVVSPAEAKKINGAYEKNVKAWRQRRRMCKGVLDMILENASMKPKELMETIGVETDEDVGCVMPTDV